MPGSLPQTSFEEKFIYTMLIISTILLFQTLPNVHDHWWLACRAATQKSWRYLKFSPWVKETFPTQCGQSTHFRLRTMAVQILIFSTSYLVKPRNSVHKSWTESVTQDRETPTWSGSDKLPAMQRKLPDQLYRDRIAYRGATVLVPYTP